MAKEKDIKKPIEEDKAAELLKKAEYHYALYEKYKKQYARELEKKNYKL